MKNFSQNNSSILDKKKGLFICFAGIDGSGKTTLSKSLVKDLETKDLKFSYVYNRYIPFTLRPFMKLGELIFLRNHNFFENYSGYSEAKKSNTKKHPFLGKIYQSILIIDYYFQTLFKIKIPLFFGNNIVCDRYIYDTIVTDLSVDFNYSLRKVDFISKLMQKFFPTPDFIFFVDVQEEVAFLRKDDVPSIEYLRDRRSLFSHLSFLFNMKKLDGTKKIDDLLRDIENELGV